MRRKISANVTDISCSDTSSIYGEELFHLVHIHNKKTWILINVRRHTFMSHFEYF